MVSETLIMLVLSLVVLFLLSVFSTWIMRVYALKRGILDVPNERSSHVVSTPSGGGVGFVIVFSIAMLIYWFESGISDGEMTGLLGGGVLVALVGFIDDRYNLSSLTRLLVHLAASTWLLFWCKTGMEINILGSSLIPGTTVFIIVPLAIIWFLNLFNFMDGIDGIAASEAIFVSLSAAILLYLSDNIQFSLVCVFLAVTIAGFLVFNWPPAKIFMGDAGSGFTGFMLASMFFIRPEQNLNITIWLILAGVFIVDASYTLLVRILNGAKWYQAHRSHAYQKLSALYGHRNTTMLVITVNVLWLLPLAILAWYYVDYSVFILTVAYLPLLITAARYSAGINESAL